MAAPELGRLGKLRLNCSPPGGTEVATCGSSRQRPRPTAIKPQFLRKGAPSQRRRGAPVLRVGPARGLQSRKSARQNDPYYQVPGKTPPRRTPDRFRVRYLSCFGTAQPSRCGKQPRAHLLSRHHSGWPRLSMGTKGITFDGDQASPGTVVRGTGEKTADASAEMGDAGVTAL